MFVYLTQSVNGTIIHATETQARQWLETFGWQVREDNTYDDNCLIAEDKFDWARPVKGHVWKMPVVGFISL